MVSALKLRPISLRGLLVDAGFRQFGQGLVRSFQKD
jgi:hypothetical protein